MVSSDLWTDIDSRLGEIFMIIPEKAFPGLSAMTVANMFILKTIYFVLQNMFWSLHTSSLVVHIKGTVNIQIIRGLLKCYSIAKNTFKNFYLIIFMAQNENIMNEKIKNFIHSLLQQTCIHLFILHVKLVLMLNIGM